MDLMDGFQSCESQVPFIPPNDESRSICQEEVRPMPHRRLLHFIPLTATDEPLHKKRFVCPAMIVPRNCESLSPGCGSLPPTHRDLCALSLGPRRELLQQRDLCALSLETYHASLPSLEVGADLGIGVTKWSEYELRPQDQDMCALSLGRRPALQSLLAEGAMPQRTVIRPQPVRPRLNNNARFVAFASEQLAQPPAQLGLQPPVTQPLAQRGQPLQQYPPHSQAQFGTQPLLGQPLGQSIQLQAHPRAQTPVQSPAQHGAQSGSHLRAQPRAQPLGQRVQPQAQARAPLGAHPPYHCPEQPRTEPLEQCLQTPAQTRSQHRAQPQCHPLAQTRPHPSLRSQARRGHGPLPFPQAQLVQPSVQPRVLPLAQPQIQGQLQPQPAQRRARRQAQPRIQLPAAQPPLQHGRGRRAHSSRFKGVTYYKRTKRWETHIWVRGKKQICLGASFTEIQAARAYDRAALHFRGLNAEINFPLADYQSELPKLNPAAISPSQLVQMLRDQSVGMGTLYPEYPQQ